MARSESDNPARPPAGVRLCALDEIKDPGGKSFRFRDGSRMFAGFVLREGGQARGFVDSCPHAGWPLAPMDDRYLTRDARHILCAGHGALFTLDGLCVAGPCTDERLTDWPVEVRGGEVWTA
ncbi:MAG: 2Fe-2S ferredoxin [Phenylobacterium sp. RIFCSPHIGHO2_01_FULL_69_31]|uniref:Rieske (2Fe-2S) protein n=1 Tax=Phenylobacterium sp. RIFCSPHIGHO2_01_FULL_69_31 TaxID=1801944 RepID=UPI0008D4396E|nr:Rieske (2Fe-2S) protein [Phenylobacterium sp. RIFCSPHIGHO2_01_FULL_69_31]OHB29756.1 MAG: 2Fe-2S ferredoxin [Phenylobacterium sp. RIFCSPHIGHO2_01_FULL_69_31]